MLDAPLPVWIIEDDDAFRDTIAQVLDYTLGLRCAGTHGSVEEALAAADVARRSGPGAMPRVVLLDVNLPGQSGIEGIGALKAALPDARIVMLTIRDDAETVYAALGAGASGFMLKSSGVDQLVVGVREAAAGGMLMPAPVARRVLAAFQDPPTAPAPPTPTASHRASARCSPRWWRATRRRKSPRGWR